MRVFLLTTCMKLAYRIIIILLKFFIIIGEISAGSAIFIFRFVRAHVFAIFYVIRHISMSILKVGRAMRMYGRRIRNSILTHTQNTWSRFERGVIGLTHSLRLSFSNGKNRIVRWMQIPLRFRLLHKKPDLSPFPSHIETAERKRRIRTKYFRLTLITISLLIILFGTATYYAYTFYINLPQPQDIGKVNFALTSHVYDRDGKLLFDFYKDQQRTPIKLADLPRYIAQATVAIEDKDFYNHRGVSLVSGIARALNETLIRKRGLQGGSTITQQLVKTALLTPERTLVRKLKEVIIALETERLFSKNKILEMYLNQVPYGGSVYGIEEASRKFFGKSAHDISLSEAALLAGLPQAPTNYSPFTNIANATARRNQVLQEMFIQKYITIDQYEEAMREPVHILENKIPIEAPHFVFYVRKYLEKYLDTNDLYQGGYMIQTTLDSEIQNKAEEILHEEISKIQYLNVSNGAILVTRPSTGEILAMVGSLDFFDGVSGEFNVTTALRQPGSAIKPILYAYALENGLTAATILDDVPTVFQTGGSEVYRPVNYDGKFHGRVTVRNALANSYNLPAVKVINRVGVPEFMDFAEEAGIETWDDPSQYGLSLALGGGDVTMTNMAQAYGVLANEGERVNLTPIINLAGQGGVVLRKEDTKKQKVIDPAYAYIISDILSDNQARVAAFGPGSMLELKGYKVAVKTGTTDEKRDNWTIGYTPDFLVVVWVGNNDHSPMNPYLTSGVTGAAPIWNRMMQYLLDEKGMKQQNWYKKPDNIVQKTCMGRNELFISGTESSVPCILPPSRKDIAGSSNATN